MAIIIALHNEAALDTCTQVCYDGVPGGECDCICQGRNHGVGFKIAVRHARWLWMFPDMLKGYKPKGKDPTMLYVHPAVLEPIRKILATFAKV